MYWVYLLLLLLMALKNSNHEDVNHPGFIIFHWLVQIVVLILLIYSKFKSINATKGAIIFIHLRLAVSFFQIGDIFRLPDPAAKATFVMFLFISMIMNSHMMSHIFVEHKFMINTLTSITAYIGFFYRFYGLNLDLDNMALGKSLNSLYGILTFTIYVYISQKM